MTLFITHTNKSLNILIIELVFAVQFFFFFCNTLHFMCTGLCRIWDIQNYHRPIRINNLCQTWFGLQNLRRCFHTEEETLDKYWNPLGAHYTGKNNCTQHNLVLKHYSLTGHWKLTKKDRYNKIRFINTINTKYVVLL